MQASLIQQQQQQAPPQSSMMIRPGGSPYGVMNRATLYDKNKRSTYSNDLRQQQMIQPGQQPSMAYGNAMGPNQPMMSNAGAQGGTGPIRPQ
jgi:L-cysteine desulfidase